MQQFFITPIQKLGWSVNRKVTACFICLVLLIVAGSIAVFSAILGLETTANSEQHISLEQADARAFAEQLQSQLNAYSDAIYLTQQKVINSSYALQPQDSITRLKLDDPQQIHDPNSNLAKIDSSYGELSKIFTQLNKFLLAGEIKQADSLWSANQTLRLYITDTTDRFQKDLAQQQQILQDASSFSSTLTKTIAVLTGVLAALLAIFFAWLISATISKPLAQTRKYLENIAKGDLTKNLYLNNKDELGDLAQALNLTVGTMRGVLESFDIGSQMQQVVDNLDLISNEQYSHANEQVSYIGQVNIAMAQLSSTAKTINENAANVATAAQTTFEQVQKVNDTTEDVSQAVHELNQVVAQTGSSIEKAENEFGQLIEQLNEMYEQSRSIEQIVSIITDIASQTHLLSLNASIEAAGAGEFGSRFAVVAREVKDLSLKCSKASEEVKQWVVHTRTNIQQTRLEAEQRQESINRIVNLGTKVGKVVEVVLERVQSNQNAAQAILEAAEKSAFQAAQIKSAAYEQQAASQQIVYTVNNITDVVNKGAKRSGEITITSSQLNSISQSLTTRLAELKLPLSPGNTDDIKVGTPVEAIA